MGELRPSRVRGGLRGGAARLVSLALVLTASVVGVPAPAQAASQGTLKVTVVAPAGVPATVLLRRKGTIRAVVKAAQGARRTVKLKVATGRWSTVAKPFAHGDGFFVPTVTQARPRVRAGRTTSVTVRWRRVATAGRLRVVALERTAVTMSFARPRKSTQVRARYAAGATPPATVRAGRAATVRGTRIRAKGLAAGRTYSVSLFTKVGTTWVGPVPLAVGTRAPANGTGSSAAYVATSGAVLVPPGASLGARPLPGARVETRLPAGVVPVVGRPVVLPSSTALPGGFVGTVRSVSADGTRVTLGQAPVAAAFDHLQLRVRGIRLREVPGAREGATGLDGERSRLVLPAGCGANGSIDLGPSLDMAGSWLDVDLATRQHPGIASATGLRVRARLVVNASASIEATLSGRFSCHVEGDPLVFATQAGQVPFLVRLVPRLELSGSGQGRLAGGRVQVTAGFEGSAHQPLPGQGRPVVDVDPVLSHDHRAPQASGAQDGAVVELTARLGGALTAGPGLGAEDLGVRAGVVGSMDVVGVRATATREQGSWCGDLALESSETTDLALGAWLPGFDSPASLTLVSRADSLGRWTVPDPCPLRPRWVGTVTTAESYEASGDGWTQYAAQTTTYTVGVPDPTYSSTYVSRDTYPGPPCGTLVEEYAGAGAGSNPQLHVVLTGGGPGRWDAQLLAGSTDHFHRGRTTWQSCEPSGGGHETVTHVIDPAEITVHPPGRLGCDLTFPVTKGQDRIRGTVSTTCTVGGGQGRSTWTYDLVLEPCVSQPRRDTDGGGLDDCVEEAYGLDPSDPADD